MRGGPSLKGKGGLVGFRRSLKGKGGRVGFRELCFSKAFSKHFPFLIPLHHNLSLFLPGKLLLPFLTILRKEPQ